MTSGRHSNAQFLVHHEGYNMQLNLFLLTRNEDSKFTN